MENYENEIFEFGNESNEELEQTSNFDYDSISGLGESNYENEDLFNVEVDTNNFVDNSYNNDFRIGSFDNVADASNENYYNEEDKSDDIEEFKIEDPAFLQDTGDFIIPTFGEVFVNPSIEQNQESEIKKLDDMENIDWNEQIEETPFEIENEEEKTKIQDKNEELINQEGNVELVLQPEKETDVETEITEEVEDSEEENEVLISDTPIEELNALTEYEEEKIEETDINSLFDRVSINVKDASDIFRKNTDLKQKIDTRFEELKKLQSEIENSRKKQIDEINAYKDEVYSKLTEKKEEIEKRLNLLKESQATLEKEKKEFEQYKKEEKENIEKVQKEVQSAYDDRREELNHIEDVLRKQKDALDEERSQLSLDKIQYEADKNDLANNLLKFNELVNSFTNGVDEIKE